ncbi:MAG: LacI family DNA-binding transcriptional regulator [Actinomycetota bacterium]
MARGQRPTLRDVARLAGLSVTQTSRALNGHSDVAVATRDRAREAARELGYVPNLEARRLKMPDTRSHSIGLVLVSSQRFSDPFFGSLLTTMVDEATARGYELQLSAPLADEDPTESYRRAILTKRVDGFVLLRTARNDPRAHYLADRSVPFVTFGRVEGGLASPTVAEAPDGLGPAVDHLVELGHRRIGYLMEPREFSIGSGRSESFVRAMTAAGLTPAEHHLVPSGFRDDTGFAAAGKLLDGPDPPTALLAANDLLALGAMRAAAARGLEVPGELSVVGFDDISAASFSTPPLTTLRHHDGAIGRELITLLLAAIDEPGRADEVFLRPELIVRGTTGPPPRSDGGAARS